MNLSNTLRELFWENPMTLEAVRTMRRSLRAGNNQETPYATRKLNIFLFGTLGFLYLWTLLGIIRASEDVSIFILVCELALMTLVIPCTLYGAIAVEREKQTYESLIMTRLTPAQIVWGKLWWRIGLILGMMALFVPLLTASHFATRHTNIDLTGAQLVWSQVQILTWSVSIAAFSLWVSAHCKKGITALLGIAATLVVFLIMIPGLQPLFGSQSVYINAEDPFLAAEYYNLPVSEQDQLLLNARRRAATFALTSNLIYALNPLMMLTSLPQQHTNVSHAYEYWRGTGVGHWGVGVFALLAAFFIRGAIKALRGLEKPVAEKVRRSRAAFALPEGDA